MPLTGKPRTIEAWAKERHAERATRLSANDIRYVFSADRLEWVHQLSPGAWHRLKAEGYDPVLVEKELFR